MALGFTKLRGVLYLWTYHYKQAYNINIILL